MRAMGLDVGDKRIGIALSDELGFTAQPLAVYERKGPRQDIAYLQGQIRQHGVTDLVIGMPYRMAGGMSTMGERVQKFVDQLKPDCKATLHFRDERLSSVEANRSMLEGDLSRKKRKSMVDVIAAQLILQGYLDSLRIQREREDDRKRWEGV